MWLEREDLEKIDGLRRLGEGSPVLSVYVPLDLGASPHRMESARIMDMLRPVRERLTGDELEGFNVEAERVLAFVRDESLAAGGLTLAVFSSAGRDVFVTLRLAVRLPAVARFQACPYLVPLDAAEENNPLVTIAVIDEREARLLTTSLGEITARDTLSSDIAKRQRQGGWAAFKYERDRAHHVEEHVKEVAKLLEGQYRDGGVRRFVLAGAPEMTAALRDALPRELAVGVAGTTTVEGYGSDEAIIDRALPVAEEAERREELALVAEIRDRVGSRGNGSLGWDQTLALLNEGRVHRLAIGAGHIGTPEGDRAIEAAWGSGAEVEFLQGEAEASLADEGGIGALLRY
jgi:hypothetical protein